MAQSITSFLFFKSLYQPGEAFAELAKSNPAPLAILLRYSLWLLALPPLFSLIGAANFGWRFGAENPMVFATRDLLLISAGYLLFLLFGLLSTVVISRWMAGTYGADIDAGRHFGLITMVGEPLAAASAVHLFPHVFINIVVLIPAIMYSMYLLYKGIPIVLDTPPERGMLMASSLVAWLLVAAVSLLGFSMTMWSLGVGPLLGV